MLPAPIVEACAAGWSLIPVGSDKRPRVPWRKFQSERADREQLEVGTRGVLGPLAEVGTKVLYPRIQEGNGENAYVAAAQTRAHPPAPAKQTPTATPRPGTTMQPPRTGDGGLLGR